MLDQLLQENDQLMEDLRAFGRVPKEVKGNDPENAAERNFAKRFRKAKAEGGASPPSTSRSSEA